MTLKQKKNHYNVKFLKGYGHSISVKNSKIILKGCHDPFSDPFIEELSEKYPSMNNLIEKILDFLRLAIIVAITINVSKDELVSTIDKSFLDSKSHDRLNVLVSPAEQALHLN